MELSLDRLTKQYGRKIAVDCVSATLKPGVYGLLGANGAGKTTLMRMLCAVLESTSGEVLLDGKEVTSMGADYRNVLGYLPQDFGYYPNYTAVEFLMYIAALKGIPKKVAKKRVTELLEVVDLSHVANKKVKTFSGGMKQRVGIAQAIVHNPPFVVLDEPTNGLDPNQIVEIRNLIKEIAEDHSVLLSTHILSEVQATCNDIRMIEHGKVVFSGSMKDFDNYVVPSSFTVTFALPPSIEELAKIEHVLNIEELYPGTFRIRFDDDENITERVVALSIQNGWRLKEITMERCSLDIIFAQLSGKLKNNI